MTTQTLASSTLPDEVLGYLPQLTTSQQTYLIALARYGTVSLACKDAEVMSDTVSTWRCPSFKEHDAFNACERAIREQRGAISVALARQHLQHHAVASAERLAERAVAQSDSPRQDAIYAHASETLLEAVGVIQRQPQVVVNSQQVQGADPAVLRRLVEAIEGERERRRALPAPAQDAGASGGGLEQNRK